MGESVGSDAGQQRFRALKRANRVRLARAETKRQIGGGQLSAAEVVFKCSWEVYRMPVSEVLMSQRRWGTQRCRRVLVATGIPENKTIGTLTDRQREALVANLGGVSEESDEGSRRAPLASRPAPARPARPVARERALSAV